MKKNDFPRIATLEQLRMVRRSLSEEISATEKRFTGSIESSIRIFSFGRILLPFVKKLRTIISGTPFAKS